jgi:large-conductance mechanosensitive channel
MSIEEMFKRLIKMPIGNMIGYVALMAIISLIGFSMVKAFNPASDSTRTSEEASKKADEALKVLDAATADRKRQEALGNK